MKNRSSREMRSAHTLGLWILSVLLVLAAFAVGALYYAFWVPCSYLTAISPQGEVLWRRRINSSNFRILSVTSDGAVVLGDGGVNQLRYDVRGLCSRIPGLKDADGEAGPVVEANSSWVRADTNQPLADPYSPLQLTSADGSISAAGAAGAQWSYSLPAGYRLQDLWFTSSNLVLLNCVNDTLPLESDELLIALDLDGRVLGQFSGTMIQVLDVTSSGQVLITNAMNVVELAPDCHVLWRVRSNARFYSACTTKDGSVYVHTSDFADR